MDEGAGGLPGFRFFLLGLLAVALVAMLYAPVREVEVPPLLRRGGVYDTGGAGHSVAAMLLEERGHRVHLDPRDVAGDGRVAVIVPAVYCGDRASYSRVVEAARLVARQGGVFIAATSTPRECLSRVLAVFNLSSPRLLGGYRVAVADARGHRVGLAWGSFLSPSPGWRALATPAYADPPPPTSSVVALEYVGERCAVVLVSSPYAFSNALLARGARAGLENHLFLVSLVENYAGPSAPVVFLEDLLPPAEPLVLRVDPGALVARVLVLLSRYEAEALGYLATSPPAFLAASLAAGVMLYLLAQARHGLRVAGEGEPVQEGPYRVVGASPLLSRLLRGERLSSEEARVAIINLYEMLDSVARARLGRGLGELLQDPSPLEARGASAENLQRLHALYERARGRRRLPLVLPFLLTWRKRLLEAFQVSEPLFGALDVSLRDEKRGVERVLAG